MTTMANKLIVVMLTVKAQNRIKSLVKLIIRLNLLVLFVTAFTSESESVCPLQIKTLPVLSYCYNFAYDSLFYMNVNDNVRF